MAEWKKLRCRIHAIRVHSADYEALTKAPIRTRIGYQGVATEIEYRETNYGSSRSGKTQKKR